MAHDLAYAARALRRRPASALTAIATLSLGIGASTAIFSVAETLLLRSLPYTDADRLVVATGEMRQRNAVELPLSGPDFLDLRAGAETAFEDLAAVHTGRALFPQADGRMEQVRFASVSPNFFRVLGGRIAIGRDFVEADGEPLPQAGTEAPDRGFLHRSSSIAILSHEYWRRRYGGRADVLGEHLSGARGGPQVVGVLAPGFELLLPPHLGVERSPDLWIAARFAHDHAQRATFSHWVIGRLRDGVALQSARAEADGVTVGLRSRFPLWETADFRIRVEPLRAYLIGRVEPALLVLMGGALALLLVACANVANLLLVETSMRERELALRTALGASRWRLIGQMAAEALWLAAMGTVLGLGWGWAALHALLAIAPTDLPRLDAIAIDSVVLATAVLLGLATAAIVGVGPALGGSRTDVMTLLRPAGRLADPGGWGWLRNAVVIAEVALSFVLLIGSGLMLRSYVALQAVDPGFEPRGLLTFQLLAPRHETPQLRAAFIRDVRARLGGIAGVAGASAGWPFPLADRVSSIRWGREDALTDASRFRAVDFQVVLPGYFETLRTPLIEGRTFGDADNARERSVVIVDQALASRAFPHESAVGNRILVRIRTPDPEWVEVIGVVAHQRASSLTEAGREQIYFTDGFLGHGAANRWAIRTAGDPAAYVGAVKAAIAGLGGQVVVSEIQPMMTLVERSRAGTRFALSLIGVFACVAALLAAVGIYGVLSTVVRQRTPEIGVRMALGATPSGISAVVVRQGLVLGGVGITIGAGAALSLTHIMRSMLVGTQVTDTPTFAAMTVLFLLIIGAASSLPARRAARLDVTVALRRE